MYTYHTICITKCFGLLIGDIWIDRIIILGIGGVGLCHMVFLMLRGSLAKSARWIGQGSITWFTFEAHGVIGINQFCRWTNSTIRSTWRQRAFGNKRVECHCRKLALGS